MKKSILAVATATIVSLSLTGCGEKKIEGADSNKNTNAINGVYSAYFSDYDDLSKNFVDNLKRINEDIAETEENTSISILRYLENVESSNTVMVPQVSGEKIKLRKKENYYSISLETKDLYSRPWLFFSFDDDDSNSYVKITDFTEELEELKTDNILEFMKQMDPIPDDDKFYPPYVTTDLKSVDMNGQFVDVIFSQMENDNRIYANFLYDNSMVIVCCSQEKIDSGFLNEFGLGMLELR